jgi:hypothetical protein
MVEIQFIKDKIQFIKDNSIFIRSGSCLRCGKCCIAYDKHPLDGGKKIPCKDLVFDEKGLATCLIHESVRPSVCVENPIYPTPCMVPDAKDTCGYSWVVNDKLTKTEALEKFNKLCDVCHRKKECLYYDEIVGDINKSLSDE